MLHNDVIVALTVPLVIWVGAIGWASSKLIWKNWDLFKHWNQQERDTLVKMSLWAGIPILMLGLFWMRSTSIYLVSTVRFNLNLISFISVLCYLALILFSLMLILFWVCDRTYGPHKGDTVW